MSELLFSTPGHWETTTLGEACKRSGGDIQTGPFGSQLHASDYVPVGIPSIMPQNIGDNRINEVGIARISDDDAQRLSRYLVRPGDIVYSRRGDVERRALIRSHENGWLCGTGCLRVRFGNGVVYPSYAAYYLGHPVVREWIVRHAQGATMPNLNTSILSALPFALPPPEEQRAIAHILGTLDDKIELNLRMNETMEAMARAIFKSWFVDFDPVRAKASELIAEGILLIGDGYRAKNDELGAEGMPFIRAGELNSGFDTANADRLKFDRLPAAKGKQSNVGDVAFTSKGTVGRFARVGEHTEPFIYSPQICFWRSLRPEVIHPAVLYCWMQSGEFASQIESLSGQTDMAPYVSLRDQRTMEVPRFPESQAQLGETIEPLLHSISEKQAESCSLADIRDTLLPKLLSGELPVTQGSH